MRTIAALLVTSALAAAPVAGQPATIVYRLGADTVAVESFTRTGNRLTGEMAQRAGPAVTRVQYELVMGANGVPASAVMRRMGADGAPLPGQASEARFRFTADSVIREVVFPDSTQRRAFAAAGAFVSFPTYVYAPFELLAAYRRAGRGVDSVPAFGFAGNAGFTGLQGEGPDALRIRGGPYPMLLRFDRSGQLVSVDGSGTTNKITGVRVSRAIDVAEIARAMRPTGVLSGRDVARAAFGPGGMVLVDYGRPQIRARTVWGGTLVPYDSVWRAGANDATHLFTTRTLTMGDLTVPPGMYTLWIQHTRTGTFLIVNRRTGVWGTQYDASQDLGRVAMTVAAAPNHVEELSITVRALAANRGELQLAWGPSVLTVPFGAMPGR